MSDDWKKPINLALANVSAEYEYNSMLPPRGCKHPLHPYLILIIPPSKEFQQH